MSEKRLTIPNARRVIDLLERCERAVKAGDHARASELAGDASMVACHSETALYGAIANIEDALNPDDAEVGFCNNCGEACPCCGRDTIMSPKEAVNDALRTAMEELASAERAAYVPRKAVEA